MRGIIAFLLLSLAVPLVSAYGPDVQVSHVGCCRELVAGSSAYGECAALNLSVAGCVDDLSAYDAAYAQWRRDNHFWLHSHQYAAGAVFVLSLSAAWILSRRAKLFKRRAAGKRA